MLSFSAKYTKYELNINPRKPMYSVVINSCKNEEITFELQKLPLSIDSQWVSKIVYKIFILVVNRYKKKNRADVKAKIRRKCRKCRKYDIIKWGVRVNERVFFIYSNDHFIVKKIFIGCKEIFCDLNLEGKNLIFKQI